MYQSDVYDPFDEYRGHLFLIEARHCGAAWTGHYRLMGEPRQQEEQAYELAEHRWTSLEPIWATKHEAEMNATEAAHAAIDALYGQDADCR